MTGSRSNTILLLAVLAITVTGCKSHPQAAATSATPPDPQVLQFIRDLKATPASARGKFMESHRAIAAQAYQSSDFATKQQIRGLIGQ